jgi:GNAT superfamily N-acetyltransferase
MATTVRAVGPGDTGAFEALFSAKGCPGFCWCAAYRFEDASSLGRDAKREAMLRRIAEGVPVGVLAYSRDEPVGWCSIAPRATYAKLARSRTMPVADVQAWTLLCLFVKRAHRGQGVTKALVAGALRYARANGATVVEAYPWDTAGLSPVGPAAHWGHSSVFAAAGFRREGETRRWTKRLTRMTKRTGA